VSTVLRRIFTVSVTCTAIALLVTHSAPQSRAQDKPAAAPAHQVIACYFHRTNRCPTCKKISAYIEESVKKGFESQVKDGSVKTVMIDFQDPNNQKMTDAYKITGPTLVLLDIHDGKVKAWKVAPRVWSLVGKKDDFFNYVHQEVTSYLEGERTAAR
jgi:thiol-disulfide isomerase/thioredoxin